MDPVTGVSQRLPGNALRSTTPVYWPLTIIAEDRGAQNASSP